jgi:hypothetical protein
VPQGVPTDFWHPAESRILKVNSAPSRLGGDEALWPTYRQS